MDIYNDIKVRTNGEIYIGVVGPVRTGKSTFIKRFMELMVLPNINDEYIKQRTIDELPQSSGGKTVMTTEPKFIPKDSIETFISDNVKCKLRLIDCVGYMAKGAEGHMEDGKERLVKTPWYDYEVPFTKAAEIGTKKVIFEHSTVGIVITSDGSVTDIERSGYIEAENRAISELKGLGKPFVVLLNTKTPSSQGVIKMAKDMSEHYGVSVIPLNCNELSKNNIYSIFEQLLLDFPINSLNFNIPKWVEAVDSDNEIKNYLVELSKSIFKDVNHMRDVYKITSDSDEYIESISVNKVNLADGEININIKLFDKYYYDMLSKLFGTNINNEYEFIKEVYDLADTKNKCRKVSQALLQSTKTGYGSVTPEKAEIRLDPPELIKSGNKYGVKLKASAPSIHLIKANITTEIAPIVGSEEQAKDLISYIKKDGMERDDIWSVSIFGKTIRQLIEEGLESKINKINQESQQKLQDTMEKIVNDSNGGMVCIII
ncbi:MAG: stage IV sporulation protein A [Lachnospiraceae bacterium]|nr:stage IV sporulation protein A [Lachnospiraceae bacterium]